MVKNICSSLAVFSTALAFLVATQATGSAQIRLSEIAVDTPSGISEPCEYIEVMGAPGSAVPPNIFFLSIDGESGNFGMVDYLANLGGLKFGANGTITIITSSDMCAGRRYPAETTIVKSSSFAMGFGAETFLLTVSTRPKELFEGQDLDANDDGVLDAKFGFSPIDGIAWVVDPAFQKVYGRAPTIFKGNQEMPDAATRFPGNTTAFSAAAWYYGELAPPDNSTKYSGPLSSNFPEAGMLTPGAPNTGAPTTGGARRPASSRRFRASRGL